MSTMSNVQLWQYVVIAGPAALVGGAVVWLLCREAMRAMEAMALAEHRGDTPSNLCNPAVERPRLPSVRVVPESKNGDSAGFRACELILNGPVYWGDQL